jgi:hypothetical protein
VLRSLLEFEAVAAYAAFRVGGPRGAISRGLAEPFVGANTARRSSLRQGYNVEVARTYFAEAIGLARALDDRWRLSQILAGAGRPHRW